MSNRDYIILKVHRERIMNAENFEQFKEAQVRFLDWLLDNYELKEKVENKIDNSFMGVLGS